MQPAVAEPQPVVATRAHVLKVRMDLRVPVGWEDRGVLIDRLQLVGGVQRRLPCIGGGAAGLTLLFAVDVLGVVNDAVDVRKRLQVDNV